MPFPSRGCRTCRQRRLKYDETRPICGQCKRSSRICLGFEAEQDSLPFRSENVYASGVARRPRRPNKANESRKASSRLTSRPQSHQDTVLGPIPRSPCLPLEDLALNLYLQSHIFASEHLPLNVQGCVEGLISVQQAANTDSLLSSIVSAVSLATFGRTKLSTEALQLGSRKYIRALAKTQDVVRNPNEAITDHFLLTVIMLGVYEHAISDFNKKYLLAESFRHQSGAMTILKLRKAQYQSVTPLDRIVRNMIVKQAVLHAVELPEWIQDGAAFGEVGVQLEMDACLVQLALLRKRSQDFWRDRHTLDSESLQVQAVNLTGQARTVDQMLSRWAANLPQDWTFSIQGEPSPSADLTPSIEGEEVERLQYGSTISLYPNLEHAATWNRYRASRMITQSVIMRALPYTVPLSSDTSSILPLIRSQQLAARGEVQACVDQICASIPYHFDVMGTNSERPGTTKPRLDNVNARKAYILAWPLTIAMAASMIPEHQRQWIRAKILLVSKITGNGALELVANMDRSMNLRGDSHSMSKQRMKEST